MGGRTLDQFNSRQQARSKKNTHEKASSVREQDELDKTQENQSQNKAKY